MLVWTLIMATAVEPPDQRIVLPTGNLVDVLAHADGDRIVTTTGVIVTITGPATEVVVRPPEFWKVVRHLDIDGDGNEEFAVIDRNHHVYAYDSTTGDVRLGPVLILGLLEHIVGRDVDGDGITELLAPTSVQQHRSTYHCYDLDGTMRWESTMDTWGGHSMHVGQFDSDPARELVIGESILDAATGVHERELDGVGYLHTSFDTTSVGDVTGDGIDDVVAYLNPRWIMWDPTVGDVVWRQRTDDSPYHSVLVDLIGDGRADFLAPSNTDDTHAIKLRRGHDAALVATMPTPHDCWKIHPLRRPGAAPALVCEGRFREWSLVDATGVLEHHFGDAPIRRAWAHDVDTDGIDELVVDADSLHVVTAEGSLRQAMPSTRGTIAVVDLEADGVLDVLSGHAGLRRLRWSNTGFRPGPALFRSEADLMHPVAVDLDGDGWRDLVHGERSLWWIRGGTGEQLELQDTSLSWRVLDGLPPRVLSRDTHNSHLVAVDGVHHSVVGTWTDVADTPWGHVVLVHDGADIVFYTPDDLQEVHRLTPPDHHRGGWWAHGHLWFHDGEQLVAWDPTTDERHLMGMLVSEQGPVFVGDQLWTFEGHVIERRDLTARGFPMTVAP